MTFLRSRITPQTGSLQMAQSLPKYQVTSKSSRLKTSMVTVTVLKAAGKASMCLSYRSSHRLRRVKGRISLLPKPRSFLIRVASDRKTNKHHLLRRMQPTSSCSQMTQATKANSPLTSLLCPSFLLKSRTSLELTTA